LIEALIMRRITDVLPDGRSYVLGSRYALSHNRKLAVKIAMCIAEWAEIEVRLAVLLSLILGSKDKATLEVFLSLGGRNGQLRALQAAAKESLPSLHFEVFQSMMRHVHAAANERDRLAHWCWGHSRDLHTLLLVNPRGRSRSEGESWMRFFRQTFEGHDEIYVVTNADLDTILKSQRETLRLVFDFMMTLDEPENEKKTNKLVRSLAKKLEKLKVPSRVTPP
jgi:hypothetical protein